MIALSSFSNPSSLLSSSSLLCRFKTAAELQRWKAGLIEWKDFNLDFGTTYPNGVGDLEGSAGKNSSHSLTANNATISPMSRATNDLDAIHVTHPTDRPSSYS